MSFRLTILNRRMHRGGGVNYTPALEILWDDLDTLAWDDGNFLAWD